MFNLIGKYNKSEKTFLKEYKKYITRTELQFFKFNLNKHVLQNAKNEICFLSFNPNNNYYHRCFYLNNYGSKKLLMALKLKPQSI